MCEISMDFVEQPLKVSNEDWTWEEGEENYIHLGKPESFFLNERSWEVHSGPLASKLFSL